MGQTTGSKESTAVFDPTAPIVKAGKGRRAQRQAIGNTGSTERPGAKANKEAMEEVQRKLEKCVMIDEFDELEDKVSMSTTAVTVFRTQMKIFEKRFLADKHHED